MKVLDCQVCGTEFKSYNQNPRFCSRKCKAVGQSVAIDTKMMAALYASGKTQDEIAVILGVSQKVIHKAMRRSGIKARVAAKRDQTGEKNHMWKGDNASKYALHRRLYSRFGKPSKCAVCGTTESRNYDYANLTGRYEDISDYLPMCRSCHWKFDKKILNIKHMEQRMTGGKNNVRG